MTKAIDTKAVRAEYPTHIGLNTSRAGVVIHALCDEIDAGKRFREKADAMLVQMAARIAELERELAEAEKINRHLTLE